MKKLTLPRGVISAISCVVLVFILPKERPVDPKGKIDVVGACLGLSSLLLFNVAWGYVTFLLLLVTI